MFKINMLPKLKASSLRPPSGWLSQAPPLGWVNPRVSSSPTSRLHFQGYDRTATESVNLLGLWGVITSEDRQVWLDWWDSLPEAPAGKVQKLAPQHQPSNKAAWVTELVFLMQIAPSNRNLH